MTCAGGGCGAAVRLVGLLGRSVPDGATLGVVPPRLASRAQTRKTRPTDGGGTSSVRARASLSRKGWFYEVVCGNVRCGRAVTNLLQKQAEGGAGDWLEGDVRSCKGAMKQRKSPPRPEPGGLGREGFVDATS
jgi:hypothetical protein